MKFHQHIEKLRALPETTKKVVLWTIVGILALFMGFFWVKGAMNNFSKISQSTKFSLPDINVQMPSVPSQNLSQTTTPSNENPIAQTALDPTANWKTYTNSEYGFEIKYPSDNFFSSAPDGTNQIPTVSIKDCNYDFFSDCPDLDKLIPGESLGWSDNTPHNGKKVIINNVEYCLYNSGNVWTGHIDLYNLYVTVRNKKCFGVGFGTTADNCSFYIPYPDTGDRKNYNDCVSGNKNQEKTINQMISTFKFTK